MTLRRAAMLACLLIVASCAGFCDNATMGRYDPRQSGFTTEKLEPPLILSWEYTSSKNHGNPAAPIVADGTCYFASGDRVYAIDMETGNLKWKYPIEQPLTSTVKATPAIGDGHLYFGTGDGKLYSLNAQTGAFEWFFETRAALRCPPLLLDGIIYLGSDDNSIYTIDATSGETAWSKPFTARDDFGNGIAVGSGMVVASCMDGNMYGVSATSGKMRWSPFRLPVAPVKTSPIMTENQTIMAVGNMMFGITTRSGQKKWVVQLPAEASATPATDGANVFVPCRNKMLYCYNITGRQPALKWVEPADVGGVPASSPTVADGIVYVAASKGVISGFSVGDGTLKWRYVCTPSATNTPGSSYTDASTSPIVANGALVILTDDGVLHCFTKVAPDAAPPDAYFLTPAAGTRMNGAPPIKFAATLYDMGSGVDFSSATLMVDGDAKELTVDYSTGTVAYATEIGNGQTIVKPLKDGVHNVSLTVKDYAGNVLSKDWSFTVDSMMPPPRRTTATNVVGKKVREPNYRRNKAENGGNAGNNDNNANFNNMATPPPPPAPGVPEETGGWQRGQRSYRANFDQGPPAPGQ